MDRVLLGIAGIVVFFAVGEFMIPEAALFWAVSCLASMGLFVARLDRR